MLRLGRNILHNVEVKKFFQFCTKTQYCTVPELAEIRFPSIKRGNYNKLSSEHIRYFKSLLGEDRVLFDLHDVEPYNIDFANHIKGRSEVVLKPKTTEEVSSLLKFCNENNLAVCPQGGNTGLVAGSVPLFDEIIISMALMNKIIHLDEFSGVITCQSGCILEVLDNYLQQHDLIMPLDLGAKGICQIGGNLSTNAGGIRLFRYGSLHGSVLGLEVVMAGGEILNLLSTMKKDNTGYHLKNIFIGAEGTLGIITKAAIQCPPMPKAIGVAFLVGLGGYNIVSNFFTEGLNNFEDVLKTFKEARSNLGEVLSACEMMDEFSFERSVNIFKFQNPLSKRCQFYILLETRSGGEGNDLEKLNSFIGKMIERDVVKDAYTTNEPTKVKAIWEIREKVSLALFRGGYVYKYDISLPLAHYYELVEIMRKRLEGTSDVTVTGFGHLGDGNLHLNICTDAFDQKLKDKIEPFVFEETERLNGSISAEHGIGLEKPGYLHLSKSLTSINVMKDLKKLFDPKGILNPYKVLPP